MASQVSAHARATAALACISCTYIALSIMTFRYERDTLVSPGMPFHTLRTIQSVFAQTANGGLVVLQEPRSHTV